MNTPTTAPAGAASPDPASAARAPTSPTGAPSGPPPDPVTVGKPPYAPGDPEPGAGDGLPLPHERDESTRITDPEPDAMIEQAARDLAAGQVDTDLRNTPGMDADGRLHATGGSDPRAGGRPHSERPPEAPDTGR